MTRRFKSLDEARRTYFPNSVLERLEEKLCHELGLTEPYQHRLNKNQKVSNAGFIEVAKSNRPLGSSLEKIKDLIVSFYQSEGYKTDDSDSILVVERREESRWIQVLETETSYDISIWQDPFSKNRK